LAVYAPIQCIVIALSCIGMRAISAFSRHDRTKALVLPVIAVRDLEVRQTLIFVSNRSASLLRGRGAASSVGRLHLACHCSVAPA